ncbi:sialic acid-binding Ig-like lectin 10 isoform X2 [Carlito syrichta]|uniref:Sialic acid-binding Ig-like lectin 10 isoform X2 n=1 Tax=Carlito syrichta TaxID=1868482 RepID=A0A1U7SRM1_CARSF|nr:sialic acid-binding Ig-like lectin 10 isoform X2 [Carlito syrichta]
MPLLLLLSLLLGGSQAQDPRYGLQIQESVTVLEGLCVSVPCSFFYFLHSWTDPTPAYGYWFKKGTDSKTGAPVATNDRNRWVHWSNRDRFLLTGNPQDKTCSLLIREVQLQDHGAYFFRVEKGPHIKHNFRNTFSLQVTGRPTTSHFPALSLIPRPQDHNTNLTCHVDLTEVVGAERTIRLRMAYAPRTPVISISRDNRSALEPQGYLPHLEAQKGQALRLLCAADSQPPATLSWVLQDRVLSWSHPWGPRTLELELPRVKEGDSGHYTCRAENRLGSQNLSLDLSVLYPPENLTVTVSQANRTVVENLGNGTSLPVLEGQSLHLVCITHSNPPAGLSWVRGGQILSPSQSSDPGVLELPRVQMEHEGEFTCLAQHPLGSQHISLSLSVHYKKEPLTTFSRGIFLGIGIMCLPFLCLILILVKILRKKQNLAETPRPKVSRSSTILDYINVVPKAGHLARNRKATPNSPSRTPPPDTSSPKSKNNQKELVALGHPGPRPPTQAPEPEDRQEEIHYAALNFSDFRFKPESQATDTEGYYAEVKFH